VARNAEGTHLTVCSREGPSSRAGGDGHSSVRHLNQEVVKGHGWAVLLPSLFSSQSPLWLVAQVPSEQYRNNEPASLDLHGRDRAARGIPRTETSGCPFRVSLAEQHTTWVETESDSPLQRERRHCQPHACSCSRPMRLLPWIPDRTSSTSVTAALSVASLPYYSTPKGFVGFLPSSQAARMVLLVVAR
jgi:hypothetical protein